jgi:Uma2 family endonuclease
MSTAEQRISPAEYLAIERASQEKHEYFNGEMFAMTGASRKHNAISGNLVRRLLNGLEGGPCEAWNSDLRVKVSQTGLYTYPDVIVGCDEPQFEDEHFDTLLNPRVIIEILSPSTEAYDRGEKFEHYRRVDSVQEYLLVAQNRVHIEHFRRDSDGGWKFHETEKLTGEIRLESVSCLLRVSDIYARVQFDEPTAKGEPDSKDEGE